MWSCCCTQRIRLGSLAYYVAYFPRRTKQGFMLCVTSIFPQSTSAGTPLFLHQLRYIDEPSGQPSAQTQGIITPPILPGGAGSVTSAVPFLHKALVHNFAFSG